MNVVYTSYFKSTFTARCYPSMRVKTLKLEANIC